MRNSIKLAAAALALSGATATLPASAAPAFDPSPAAGTAQTWQHSRDRDYRRYDGYGYRQSAYAEPVYQRTPVWRGRDGRYYCRKKDGTTGMIIGGAVGGLLGNEIAGRGDRTVGTILGVAGGALLGRAVDRSNARCR